MVTIIGEQGSLHYWTLHKRAIVVTNIGLVACTFCGLKSRPVKLGLMFKMAPATSVARDHSLIFDHLEPRKSREQS